MKKTWGGRFQKATDPQVEAFTESISFDHRLGPFDIEGSIAHVKTLVKAKLLTAAEGKKLVAGLQKVKKALAAGKLPLDSSLEDIHTAVEKALTRLVGPLGGKLHTGRSRNDQVATDMRLYLRHAVIEAVEAATGFGGCFVQTGLRGKRYFDARLYPFTKSHAGHFGSSPSGLCGIYAHPRY